MPLHDYSWQSCNWQLEGNILLCLDSFTLKFQEMPCFFLSLGWQLDWVEKKTLWYLQWTCRPSQGLVLYVTLPIWNWSWFKMNQGGTKAKQIHWKIIEASLNKREYSWNIRIPSSSNTPQHLIKLLMDRRQLEDSVPGPNHDLHKPAVKHQTAKAVVFKTCQRLHYAYTPLTSKHLQRLLRLKKYHPGLHHIIMTNKIGCSESTSLQRWDPSASGKTSAKSSASSNRSIL